MSLSGGSDVEPDGRGRPVSRPPARRRVGSTAPSVRSVAADPCVCFYCTRPCHEEDAVKKWHGYVFHASPCWNPVRARTRICLEKPNGLRRELEMMAQTPDVWRIEAQSFDTTIPGNDRAQARSKLSTDIDSFSDQLDREAELVINDVMKYTKQQYKDARLRGMDDDEASVDWDTKYEENPTTNTNGDPCIAIDAPEVARSLTGTERHAVKRTSDGSDRGSVNPGGASRGATAGRPKWSAGLLARTPSLTESNVRQHQRGVQDSAAPSPGGASVMASSVKGITRASDSEQSFLHEKDNIDLAFSRIVNEIGGSKKTGVGVIKHLENAHNKAVEKELNVSDLPSDIATVLGDLQRLVTACKAEQAKIPDAKKEVVPAMREALNHLEKQKTELLAVATNLQTQLQHKYRKATSSERSAYQVTRWKKEKMAQALVKGGAAAHLAKWLAEMVVSRVSGGEDMAAAPFVRERVQENPSEMDFDLNLMAVFTKDNPAADNQEAALWQSIHQNYDAAFNAFATAKVESVTGELRSHVQWPSAMGRITDCWAAHVDSIAAFDAKDVQTKGAEMWMVGSRMDYMRQQPSAVPLPGTPCLIRCVQGPLLINAIAMKVFLDLGIAATDYQQHLTTPSGGDTLKKSSVAMLMNGDVAYVPAGWHWSIVAMASQLDDLKKGGDGEVPKAKAKGKAKAAAAALAASTETFGFAAVATIWSEKLVEALPQNVRTAVAAVNGAHFETKAGRAMWAEREGLFKKYFVQG